MSSNNWFIKPLPKPNADLKILCFPFAGGNAATYLSWAKWLPTNVELIAIQPPGRTTRMFEPLFSDMASLVTDLMTVIPNIIDRPYVLFGHSLGSRVAFELMAQCKKNNLRMPSHFIASGSKGPHMTSKRRSIHQLPDKEFIVELKKLNGTPVEVLENEELLELYLPMLRADFKIADNYRYASDTVFDCPISVLGGTEDSDISTDDLQSWESFFSQPADVQLFAGDHFFIESNKQLVASKVQQIIQNVLKKTRA